MADRPQRTASFMLTVKFHAPRTYSNRMLGEYLEGAVRRTIDNDPHGITEVDSIEVNQSP